MNPSVANIRRWAKYEPDGLRGYVAIPLSTFDGALWILEMAERYEDELSALIDRDGGMDAVEATEDSSRSGPRPSTTSEVGSLPDNKEGRAGASNS